MRVCDPQMMDDYLGDHLSAEEATACESHLTECASCCEEFLTRTADAGFVIRRAGHWDRIPENVNLRVRALARPRYAGWPWAAAAAAASLAVFFMVRATTGPQSQAAFLITPRSPLSRPEGTIRTRGIARVRLLKTQDSLLVVPLLGSVEVAPSTAGALSVRAKSWTATIKGRCIVDVSPSGDVRLTSLGESITMAAQSQTRTIPNGYSSSLAVWDLKPAGDDPFALASREAMGEHSFLTQLAERMKVPVQIPSDAESLSSGEIQATERASDSESLTDIVNAAKVLAYGERTEAAAQMAGWALQISPSLAGVSVEDRRILVAGLARDRGDLQVASQFADVPELRDWKRFVDAWNALPEYPTVAERQVAFYAAKAIIPRTPAEQLSLAEGFGLMGRALFGKHLTLRCEPGLLESERLGHAVARDPSATPAQRAMGFHAVSESVHYIRGRETEGLNRLKQAIQIWRRPHWLVHYASRFVEVAVREDSYDSSLDRNRLASMVIEGLAGDPSFDSFDRAMVMLRDLGTKSPADQVIARDFMVWVADAFPSVPRAQELCASHLSGWYQAPEAKRIQARWRALLRENPSPSANPTQ